MSTKHIGIMSQITLNRHLRYLIFAIYMITFIYVDAIPRPYRFSVLLGMTIVYIATIYLP
jgi:hypothetical protein